MNKRSSLVWNFFSILDEKKQTAKCNMCKNVMSYKTTVSNLKKHITRRHPTVQLLQQEYTAADNLVPRKQNDKDIVDITSNKQVDVEPIPSTSGGEVEVRRITSISGTQMKISTFVPKAISASSKKKMDQALLKLFYKDFQPFRVVDDEGFKQYSKALNPSYIIPSRQVISRTLIPALYEECLIYCKEQVKDISSLSLTTDCWTSANQETFMGVTIHFIDDAFKHRTILLKCAVFDQTHTSANLAIALRGIAEDWCISNKIILAVSDNAPNITNAIKNELGWKFFGCYAHTLNLVVKDALKLEIIAQVVEKVKIIVTFFKRSTQASLKLSKFQESRGVSPKKLIQDVPTRWNSTFYMIERFVELEECIRSTVAILDSDLPLITSDDWCTLKDLKVILDPFEDATNVISGQQYLVASMVIVVTNGLLDVCERFLTTNISTPSLTVVKKLQHGLRNRFGNLEYSSTLATTTFLDPRFKTLPFKNKDAVERVRKNIVGELAAMISIKEQPIPTEEKVEDKHPKLQKQKISIWDKFDQIAEQEGTKTQIKSSTSRAIIEIQRYLEEDIVHRSRNPMEWWKEHQYMYPNLVKLVKSKLCAVATSVPCESLFSKAGQILSERRRSLKSKHIHQLLFLNYNTKFLE